MVISDIHPFKYYKDLTKYEYKFKNSQWIFINTNSYSHAIAYIEPRLVSILVRSKTKIENPKKHTLCNFYHLSLLQSTQNTQPTKKIVVPQT